MNNLDNDAGAAQLQSSMQKMNIGQLTKQHLQTMLNGIDTLLKQTTYGMKEDNDYILPLEPTKEGLDKLIQSKNTQEANIKLKINKIRKAVFKLDRDINELKLSDFRCKAYNHVLNSFTKTQNELKAERKKAINERRIKQRSIFTSCLFDDVPDDSLIDEVDLM